MHPALGGVLLLLDHVAYFKKVWHQQQVQGGGGASPLSMGQEAVLILYSTISHGPGTYRE